MKRLLRGMVVFGAVMVALVATPGAAQAETGGEFGDHVSACAHMMLFGGDHNPGMHQGFAGWTAMHEC